MTTTDPTLSVIITCFNYERYVANAIESVLSQSRPANEIIVVDDGSTDRSREIIQKFGTAIVPIFQRNAGPASATLSGFRASHSEIILFLDADDALLPDAVRQIASAWRPGASKLQYNLEIIDSLGHRAGRLSNSFPKSYNSSVGVEADFARLGTYVWPVTSGNAYARQFLAEGLNYTPPISYDGLLNSIAPLYGDVITLDRPLAQYRIHDANISRRDASGRSRQYPDFVKRIEGREKEIEIARNLSSKRDFEYPKGNILDNEIVFVNYRMAALRLGTKYQGCEVDTLNRLWKRGIALAFENRSITGGMANIIWFVVLRTCPKHLVAPLLVLRFQRKGLTTILSSLINNTSKTSSDAH